MFATLSRPLHFLPKSPIIWTTLVFCPQDAFTFTYLLSLTPPLIYESILALFVRPNDWVLLRGQEPFFKIPFCIQESAAPCSWTFTVKIRFCAHTFSTNLQHYGFVQLQSLQIVFRFIFLALVFKRRYLKICYWRKQVRLCNFFWPFAEQSHSFAFPLQA